MEDAGELDDVLKVPWTSGGEFLRLMLKFLCLTRAFSFSSSPTLIHHAYPNHRIRRTTHSPIVSRDTRQTMAIPVRPGSLMFHDEFTHVEGTLNLAIISPEELMQPHLAT